jgi:spore germination cell wall hydrolase CwlJ-like protein
MLFDANTNCLANNIYYEARNQPIEGQIAVAKVVLNRVEDERWPSSTCSVVYQNKQFSWTSTSPSEPKGEAWQKAKTIAVLAYILPDPTNGATHFHANYVQPYWAKKFKKKKSIGDHIFYA